MRSFLGNVSQRFYGNITVVHAAKDVKNDDELTVCYCDMSVEHEGRKKAFKTTWEFKCQCQVCEMENDESDLNSKQVKLPGEFKNMFHSYTTTPQRLIKKGEPPVKQAGN